MRRPHTIVPCKSLPPRPERVKDTLYVLPDGRRRLWNGKYLRQCCLECTVEPHYGLPNQRPQWCRKHASREMIDVRHPRCKHTDCHIQPNYGLPDERPQWCREHASREMIDVRHPRCKHTDCHIQASFGLPDERPQWCRKHASREMIDVRNPRCKHQDCRLRPSFGLPDERPQWCWTHATEDMGKVPFKGGASKAACQWLDQMEKRYNVELQHIHYTDNASEGSEARRLIPKRRFRPDGYHKETRTVWLFHGNWFHGYPPGHDKHETFVHNGRWGPDLYDKTMAQMQLYKDNGYNVMYAWEYDRKLREYISVDEVDKRW